MQQHEQQHEELPQTGDFELSSSQGKRAHRRTPHGVAPLVARRQAPMPRPKRTTKAAAAAAKGRKGGARDAQQQPPQSPAGARAAPPCLLDLPLPWLHALAGSATLTPAATRALLRTCTALRDLVLEARPLVQDIDLPVEAPAFPVELRNLCTALRRSRRVAIRLQGVGHHLRSVHSVRRKECAS